MAEQGSRAIKHEIMRIDQQSDPSGAGEIHLSGFSDW